jgi:hypothetical protein
MKTLKILGIVFAIGLLLSPHAGAGILGDIDNDGDIGLAEAVNALQIASRVRTSSDASYIIVWKGPWTAGQNYQPYDVVQSGGSSYLCKEAHLSDGPSQPPSARWDLMAQKGADGTDGVTPDLTPLVSRISLIENYSLPFAFVTNPATDQVTPINLLRHAANRPIQVGIDPSGIALQPGGIQVWVANTTDQSLSVIDRLSSMVVKTIPGQLGSSFGEDLHDPQSVAFNAAGSRVYIGGIFSLAMFDAGSMTPLVSKRVSGTVSGLSLAGSGEVFGIVDGRLFYIRPNSPFWDPASKDDKTAIAYSSIPAEALAVKTAPDGSILIYLAQNGALSLYAYGGGKTVLTERYIVKSPLIP